MRPRTRLGASGGAACFLTVAICVAIRGSNPSALDHYCRFRPVIKSVGLLTVLSLTYKAPMPSSVTCRALRALSRRSWVRIPRSPAPSSYLLSARKRAESYAHQHVLAASESLPLRRPRLTADCHGCGADRGTPPAARSSQTRTRPSSPDQSPGGTV